METVFPATPVTIMAQATVVEDGLLHIDYATAQPLTPGARVFVTISPIGQSAGISQQSLSGTVLQYDDPFGPATSTEDWEAIRQC